MAYTKTTWKDRVVEKPRTYTMTDNGDGTITLTPSPGVVTEAGTPIIAANLNNIEDALESHDASLVEKANKTTADISYYVSTLGSDSNDGLTPETAFATIQHAIDMLPQVINHTITINIDSGTYIEYVVVDGFLGKGNILLVFGTAVNDTYLINNLTISNCQIYVYAKGFKCQSGTLNSITVTNCTNVLLNYCKTSVIGAIDGLYAKYATVTIQNSLISGKANAITSYTSLVQSTNNTGDTNTVALNAIYGGTIGKGSTQPTGTTAEKTQYGGVIR